MKTQWMVVVVLSLVSLTMLTGCGGGPKDSDVKTAFENVCVTSHDGAKLVDCKIIDHTPVATIENQNEKLEVCSYNIEARYVRKFTDEERAEREKAATSQLMEKIALSERRLNTCQSNLQYDNEESAKQLSRLRQADQDQDNKELLETWKNANTQSVLKERAERDQFIKQGNTERVQKQQAEIDRLTSELETLRNCPTHIDDIDETVTRKVILMKGRDGDWYITY